MFESFRLASLRAQRDGCRRLRPPAATLLLHALVVASIHTPPVSSAQETDRFVYETVLLDESGDPMVHRVEMTFAIYRAAEGGLPIAGPWTHSRLPDRGRVSVDLGPVPLESIPPESWLELSVAGRARPREPLEVLYYDAPDASGRLSGGKLLIRATPVPEKMARGAASFTTLIDNGPPSNRIDISCVGDGYTSAQLALYNSHAVAGVTWLFSQEPFARYSTYFNVHRVDVISAESGVDNDPVEGIFRDTALHMGFWCSGIERLLCVNTSTALTFASSAPDADQVLAIANSTKYGGAGYTGADVATFSGGNASAPEVAVHELGHSLGNLADEYNYGQAATYTGPELPEANVSVLNAAQMTGLGTKWADWLGNPGIGFDGLVDTYQGGAYHQFGVYRPTLNSKMNALGRPFNLPSVEELLIQFYGIVHPIDGSTPTFAPLFAPEFVMVDPLDPVGSPLAIQWFVDGAPVAGATQDTLWIDALSLAPGSYDLMVTVTDTTSWVMDEVARAFWMSDSLSWELHPTCTTAPPTVALVSPNGSEVLCPGTLQSVTWTGAAVPYQYEIEFSTDAGFSWMTVGSGLAEGDGSASWLIPAQQTTEGRVRVSAMNCAGSDADESDASFSIPSAPPTLSLLGPVGGEALCALAPALITWQNSSSCPATSHAIELSTNSGSSWTPIFSGSGSANGTYLWTVPPSETTQGRVRVTLTNTSGSDAQSSPADFAIISAGTPAPLVVSPNGGESWAVGSTHDVTWDNASCAAAIHRIDYSSDGGSSWALVHEDSGSGSGAYAWTLPGQASATARVRVTLGNLTGAEVDACDATFTILGAPLPVNFQPAGGEIWVAGTLHAVSWANIGGLIATHSVDFSTDSGASWLPLITDAAGDGGNQALVAVPSLPSTTAKMRVTLVNGAGAVSAATAGVFTVAPTAEYVDVAGASLAGSGGEGCVWIDFDGDGDEDLVRTAPSSGSALLANDGRAEFSDVTPPALAHLGLNVHASTWADYDNDGDADAYVSIGGAPDKLVRNDGGTFTDVTVPPLDNPGDGRCAAWGDYDRDGDVDVYVVNFGQANLLLRNDGATFADVTSGPLANAGLGTHASWSDVDLDGDADLYVVNLGANVLLRNDAGTFVSVGAGDAGFGIGASWGDYDADGDPDCYVSNLGANSLLRNDGAMQLTAVAAGPLNDPGSGAGTAWVDTDLDGDLDLYLANQGQPNHLFRNDGTGFVDATPTQLAGGAVGQGGAWGDADGNGMPDLYLANTGSPSHLFLNFSAGSRHWLAVRLTGTVSNRSAIGARVRVQAAGTQRYREVSAASGYASQSSLIQNFGLGSATSADVVEVKWPSGAVQSLTNVSADQLLDIVEGDATAILVDASLPEIHRLHSAAPNPFRGTTDIRYDLPAPGRVGLRIYDVRGRLVRNLVDEDTPAGRHSVTWDGRDSRGSRVASGVFFVRIETPNWRATDRILRLR